MARKVGCGVVALLSYDKRELSIIRWAIGPTPPSTESLLNGPWAAIGSTSFSLLFSSFHLFSSIPKLILSLSLFFIIFI